MIRLGIIVVISLALMFCGGLFSSECRQGSKMEEVWIASFGLGLITFALCIVACICLGIKFLAQTTFPEPTSQACYYRYKDTFGEEFIGTSCELTRGTLYCGTDEVARVAVEMEKICD